MTNALAEGIKLAIRRLLPEAESAPNPCIRIAALLAELGLEVYPYVKAYFDPPKSLEPARASSRGNAQPPIGEDSAMTPW
jgi:hypothetical protein